ncbi:MAG TPA: alpha/beta fold hydrolase [Acidimicrobiales bacterium]|nr:alpha/beta fold hydrolase [Acidimicrobiales bacterium]
MRPLVRVRRRGVEALFESEGLRLGGHLARPATAAANPPPGLVLCHGFPSAPGGAAASGQNYPALASRLAAETGWTVLTFNFRGAGGSEGNFSLGGWFADLRAAVARLREEGVSGAWIAGSSTGGALAICAAAADPSIRGVAAMAAPATFDMWAAHPRRFLDHARTIGVIRDRSFPPDVDHWSAELSELRPLDVVGKVPPRPVLLMHGTDDDVVPVQDARTLATAAGNRVDLRLVHGAGHRLRHDPRAVAFLLGWMERHGTD